MLTIKAKFRGVLAALACLMPLGFGHAQPVKVHGFQSQAPHAILLDVDTGAILYEKAADEPIFPASMAKIMTAETVFHEIKAGRLKLDAEFRISEDAWRRGGAPSGGSTMFAALGSNVKVSDLLQGLIVQSGNDAAIALAEGIAGSEPNFVGMMNKRAKELGLTHSTFMNATGLPDDLEKTTARDLANLARYVIETYPDLYKYFGQREFTWNKIRQLNRNPLIPMEIGADGLKTGYTKEAGYGLVGSTVQNGRRLIAVVAGLKTGKERAEEARRLIDYGYRAFVPRDLFPAGAIVGEASIYGGVIGSVPLAVKDPVRILVQRGVDERVDAKIVYQGPLQPPVKGNTAVGHLVVTRGDVTTLEMPVYTAMSVPKGTLSQRAADAAIELSIGWFRRLMAKL